jgi:N-acetylmuramoyl-L-alanine amidase
MTPQTGKWTHVVIHHSATVDQQTFSWSAIRRFHTTDPGHLWSDIGYHYGVEIVGTEYEALVGRPADMLGAHCPQGNMNRLALGICVVGNYDIIPPSGRALRVLRDRLLRPLMRQHGIPRENIVFHRDFNPAKSCPGDLFTRELLEPFIP